MVLDQMAVKVYDPPHSDKQLVSGFQNICLKVVVEIPTRECFHSLSMRNEREWEWVMHDPEEMRALSTWDYNADEFHILVREFFLLKKEKTRKKSLVAVPVTEKQTEMQLNAGWNVHFSWIFFFLFWGVCVCKKMAWDFLAHFSAFGPSFPPRWPDLADEFL